MNRSNSSFSAIIAILIIAGCFVYSWQILVPTLKADQISYKQTSAEVAAARSKLESLQTTKTDLEGLGKVVNDMFVAIPADKDTPNLITELEAIGTKYGMAIPSIEIGGGNNASVASGATTPGSTNSSASIASSNAIPVAFTVTGNFENINNFIKSIENDVRFMNIKSMVIGSTDNNMTLTLQLEVYKRIDTSLSAGASSSPTASSSNTVNNIGTGQ